MNTPAKNQALSGPVRGGSGAMFDGIAHRYDLLNRLMSFGVDKRWRKKTVQAMCLGPNPHVLDLATGTGDLAFDVLATHTDAQVTGVDPSCGMLQVGQQKAINKGLSDQFRPLVGVGENLPFENDTFDGACIAFGIRNCVDRSKALSEIYRVLRPGAKVAILELGQPRKGLLSWAAGFHVRHIVPRIGALLSGSKEYRYLQESIAAFPTPSEFSDSMKHVGFKNVGFESLTFDSCHLYVGERGPLS